MKSIIVAAGLFAAPACAPAYVYGTGGRSPDDPRLTRVRQFFDRCRSPLSEFAEDFIRAADENHLDWRLLPSISLVESGAGKRYAHNNIFGWAQTARFPSVRAAIHAVASHLGTSRLYRNKTIPDVLKTYNPKPGYHVCVEAVMRTLGPAPRSAALN